MLNHSSAIKLALVLLFVIGMPSMALAQMIVLWPGETAPKGWLFCDGAELSKDAHPALFKTIGTTYGGNDDKFALPDLRGADKSSRVGVEQVRYIISDGYPGSTLNKPPAGLIFLFAANFAMDGFAFPEGQVVKAGTDVADLTKVLAKRFTPDPEKGLGLPDLREAETGWWPESSPKPVIALTGVPLEDVKPDPSKQKNMEPFLAQVVLYAGSVPPPDQGWIACKNQYLTVSTFLELFSVLGNIYGGDGRMTFALPDLRKMDKVLKATAGLDETSDYLFHMVSFEGSYPER